MTIEKECKAPNCTNEASKLRCPDCAKYQINSLFCSQDCFKKCWKQHKNFHKIFNNCQRMLQAMTQEERDNLENDFKGGNIFAGIYYTGSRNAEGQKHGHGTFYWLNGSVYEGEFSYDKQNGRGKHFGFNGDVFEGEYKNDQMHGYGEYRWADGGVYKGTWERDKMHGHGFRTWPNGAHHEGEYRDGLRNGEGKMVHSNGEVFNGIFVNDEKKEGQYTFITGDVFIGPFRNDRPEGNGKLIKSNGETIFGHFRNGVFTRGEKKKASSDELCISDLEVGRTHNGQVLSGIIISKPMKMSALHFTLQDSEKAEMTVSVYNYPGYQDTRGMIVNKSSLLNFDTCGLEKGKKIRIRNPYCKVAMDGQILIRVDDFSNIEFMN